jgi:hypothetical protein
MNEAALWFLIIGSINGMFPPSRLGPITEDECKALVESIHLVAPTLDGRCRKVVGAFACQVPGRPGSSTACPIIEDELAPRTGGDK